VEIEIAKHAKLKGRVNSPSRLGFGYGDGVMKWSMSSMVRRVMRNRMP
jgi:hypothetical protein